RIPRLSRAAGWGSRGRPARRCPDDEQDGVLPRATALHAPAHAVAGAAVDKPTTHDLERRLLIRRRGLHPGSRSRGCTGDGHGCAHPGYRHLRPYARPCAEWSLCGGGSRAGSPAAPPALVPVRAAAAPAQLRDCAGDSRARALCPTQPHGRLADAWHVRPDLLSKRDDLLRQGDATDARPAAVGEAEARRLPLHRALGEPGGDGARVPLRSACRLPAGVRPEWTSNIA